MDKQEFPNLTNMSVGRWLMLATPYIYSIIVLMYVTSFVGDGVNNYFGEMMIGVMFISFVSGIGVIIMNRANRKEDGVEEGIKVKVNQEET